MLRVKRLDLGDDSRVGDQYRTICFQVLQGLDLGGDSRGGDEYRGLRFLELHGLDFGDMECPEL